MKKCAMIFLTLITTAAGAMPYKLDTAHTEVGFGVTHMMISKVRGRFTKFEGTFNFDEKKSELKDIQVTIQTPSISTDNKDRDEHLSGKDFFDVAAFPTMTFKSTKIESKGGKPVQVIGNLTMKGVTKPVTLDVEYRGSMTDPKGISHVGFAASGKISRKDFGLTWNKTLDKGGVAVGDEVLLQIDGEAVSDSTKK